MERTRRAPGRARRRGDGLRGRALLGHRLHRRAHAACVGRALRAHEPQARGLLRDVRQHRARTARRPRARAARAAVEHRAGPSAPAGPAAREPRAVDARASCGRRRPWPRCWMWCDRIAVVPVGRIAERALADLGIAALPSVRHPAQGGATQFRAQAGAALASLL